MGFLWYLCHFMGFFSVFSPTTVVLDRRSSPSGFSANERGHFRKYTAPLAVPITEKDCESQAAKAPEGLDPVLASQRSVCLFGGGWGWASGAAG